MLPQYVYKFQEYDISAQHSDVNCFCFYFIFSKNDAREYPFNTIHVNKWSRAYNNSDYKYVSEGKSGGVFKFFVNNGAENPFNY
jgi:hypothetical protein